MIIFKLKNVQRYCNFFVSEDYKDDIMCCSVQYFGKNLENYSIFA